MSLETAELRIKDEPWDSELSQTGIPIKHEPEIVQADYIVQQVKVEREDVAHDVSEVSSRGCEADSALTGHMDHVKMHSDISEDVDLFIKHEVKDEIFIGPEVFHRPSVHQGAIQHDRVTENIDALRKQILLDLQKQQNREHLYNCSQCSFTSRYKNNLTRHERGHNKVPGSRQPNKKTKQPVQQNNPVDENPYKCTYCPYMTRYKINYTRHETQHIVAERIKHLENKHRQLTERATEIKPVNEQNCEQTIEQAENLLKHDKPEEPLKCTLDDVSALKNARKCLKSKEKPFKCTYCSFSCDLKGTLESHERMHTSEGPFKCTHCDYSFAYKSSIMQHARTNSELKPFKCTDCSYTSPCKKMLKRHASKHNSKTILKCTNCNYRSFFKSNLNRHKVIHNNEKSFKCTYCFFSSVHKRSIKCHERLHFAENTYKCSYCTYSCTRYERLSWHERLHSEDETNKREKLSTQQAEKHEKKT